MKGREKGRRERKEFIQEPGEPMRRGGFPGRTAAIKAKRLAGEPASLKEKHRVFDCRASIPEESMARLTFSLHVLYKRLLLRGVFVVTLRKRLADLRFHLRLVDRRGSLHIGTEVRT